MNTFEAICALEDHLGHDLRRSELALCLNAVAELKQALKSYSQHLARQPVRRVMQTVLGLYGNCQSACLAALLGVPLADVPNFAQIAQDIGDNEAYEAQCQWLRERGWGILTVVRWQSLPWPPRHGYFIAGGVSPRGNRHSVIYKDGELWHDPHPEGGGIASVDDIDFLYPLNPMDWVRAGREAHCLDTSSGS